MANYSQFNSMSQMTMNPMAGMGTDPMNAMLMNPMMMYGLDPYQQAWPTTTDPMGQLGQMTQMGSLVPQMTQTDPMNQMAQMNQMALYYPQMATPTTNAETGYETSYTGVVGQDGRKRGRDDADPANSWKRQQVGGFASPFMPGNATMMMYPQATMVSNGTTHPCIRVYGFCRIGPTCRFSKAPIGVCLQHLKGNCRFGNNCREPHISMSNAGDKHPCMRVYGFCRDGDNCIYANYPAENCLQFLKGRCRFAESCREPHANPSTASAAGPEKRA